MLWTFQCECSTYLNFVIPKLGWKFLDLDFNPAPNFNAKFWVKYGLIEVCIGKKIHDIVNGRNLGSKL